MGKVPPYSKCTGCNINLAILCLSSMRSNESGTVHPDCKLEYLHQQYDQTCCPRYNSRKQVIYNTAAYPQGLECLRKIGCEMSQVSSISEH